MPVQQASGDGIYSGQWTPPAGGNYTLTFPGGDVVTVQVVQGSYAVAPTSFSYRNITGTSLNLDDDTAVSIVSPFPVPFGGGSFTTLFVSSNGNVNFSVTFTDYVNASIPVPQDVTLVAPFWDDLFPVVGTSQNVFWAVTGTAPSRELVIEWRNVEHFDCAVGATVKFQVVFFESSSNVLFNYADTTFGGCVADQGGSATVGVQVSSSVGTQYSSNTQSLSSSSALLWTLTPPPAAINVRPSSRSFGNVPLGSSQDLTFTVQNVGGGVVTGTATTSAPFAVVSGGAYSLSTGQSQSVTVRFSPLSVAMFSGSVAFSGTGGASRFVSGAGIAVSPIAPAGLTGVATSSSQINLAWQDTNGNETESRVERKTGACSGATTLCTLTLNDARSVAATFSVIFTDATSSDLLPDATPVTALHFTELLDAINAVQPGTNLSWPGPTPAAGGAVLAIHMQTL